MQQSHVLHLIKGLGRGGAEVLLSEGLAVADRAAFRYSYGYFLPFKNAMVPQLEGQAAATVCFNRRSAPGVVAAAHRIARFVREHEVDLVHAHLPVSGVAARIAGRLARVPVVYTEHNLLEHYHPLSRSLSRATWRLQSEVIAVSQPVADSIRACVGSDVPVLTIRNGVNVRAFDPAAFYGSEVRRSLGIPRLAPVVGTVAVFRPQKRLGDWIEVAARLAESSPDAHFVIVGDGPERTMVEERVDALGLGGRVHLVGLQDEIRPYFAAMDVYLMTSSFEGLPVALLEAMAMGVPPVATAVGGIPELIRSGEHGLLRPVGEVAALAEDVRSCLADPERRRQLGHAARARVAQDFSMVSMQRALEQVYARVLNGKVQ